MEATSAAAPSPPSPLSEMQSNQMPVTVTQEQILFEYLIDVEKGLGIAGEFANPAALFSKALDHAGEVSQQVQDLVKSIVTRSGESTSTRADEASGAVQAQNGRGAPDSAMDEIDMGQIVEQFWSATWTVYGGTAVTISVGAATSSAQSLIHQS
jgi:hypothetical protein